ncbi:hypothetical protein [Hymenobacter convexus]|uniref:hypothetical protein n=1 Tax=Hymenobacter sp. CA1UV-4 TaxID=3063782 RepID=UPI002712D90D|nr:hypothetical protein [Hymenobacter sp. CA1UV-4]MDO7852203.1 hypothetical protein [Hymenobacter sp. CA1UV-4]
MKALFVSLAGTMVLVAGYGLRPLQGSPPLAATSAPVLTSAITLDRLLWLRDQPLPTANRYLQSRGWKFISKDNDTQEPDPRYARTAYIWAYPKPAAARVADTLTLSTGRYPVEMGILRYHSPKRDEYARIWAAVKARRLPYSGHSGPANSDFMVFDGPHQHIFLTIEAEGASQDYQVGIEYRDPKMVEFLPPPMPPKRHR